MYGVFIPRAVCIGVLSKVSLNTKPYFLHDDL